MSVLTKTGAALNVVFGSVELSAAILGIVLNTLTLPYFCRRRKQFSSKLYMLIVITDIVTSLVCIPSAVSMIYQRQPMWLNNKLVCTFTGFVLNITARMSVFLIAMLNVARSVSLAFPFRFPCFKHYLPALVGYFLLNVILASMPLIYSENKYYYTDYTGQCSWGIGELSFVNSTNSTLFFSLINSTIILPWLIPGFVVIISCLVSVFFVTQSTRALRDKGCAAQGATYGQQCADRDKRAATATIIIMTLVYIALTVPSWLFYISVLVSIQNPVTWLQSSFALYLNIFVSRLSSVMNAGVNPIVYFCRIRALRRIFSHASTGSQATTRSIRQNMSIKGRTAVSMSTQGNANDIQLTKNRNEN